LTSADEQDVKWILILAAAVCSAQMPAGLQRAAMEQQCAAAQKQAENAGARLKPWGEVMFESGPAFESAKPECDAMAESVATPLVEGAAREQGVDA
jgi:hypothetical protein